MTKQQDYLQPFPSPIRFSPFVLDMVEGCLRRGDEVVPLRARALAVLYYLAQRPNRLVTKDELLAAVWPGVSVTEVVLAVCVSELRKVLGDGAKAPRFVETVHGRGYRFIAAIDVPEGSCGEAPRARCPLVGRDQELEQLTRHLERTLAGERQIVF